MFQNDLKDLPEVSESLATTFQSQSADSFVAIVKDHMKNNKEYDFLRIEDNPYRAYYLRERMAAFQAAVRRHVESVGQKAVDAPASEIPNGQGQTRAAQDQT